MRFGEVVADRFVLEGEAGSGGMGTVYRARDRFLGTVVALKVMHKRGAFRAAPSAANADRLERFSREAELLADLRHPAIVRYVSHGLTGGGEPFLVMEWLEGKDLCEHLTAGRLASDDVVLIAERVADALAAAHARGIIHRDLKPSNVFLPDGDVKRAMLLDFGQARLTHNLVAMTRTGAIVGTPGYMAPEQVRGDEVGPRADVFSLGCVLFECLTGRPAFVGEHVLALLSAILLDRAPRPRAFALDVPESLDDLVTAMLAKDPAERPADAIAVRKALADAGRSTSPGSVGCGPPPGLTGAEQRVASILVAGAGSSSGRTLATDEAAVLRAATEQAVASHGCRLHVPTPASYVVTAEDGLAPADQVVSIARAALALVALSADLPFAIATGRAVRADRLPLGALVDAAVKTLAGARAGTVRVDAATRALLDPRFEIASDHGASLLLRERDEPVRRTLLGRATPCVGRDRELAALEGAFDDAVAAASPRAVLVTAAAGAGKSRLRHELVSRVAARRPDALLLIGRGDSMSAGAPFAMLAGAIRRATGILDGESAASQKARLGAWLAGRVPASIAIKVTSCLAEMAGAWSEPGEAGGGGGATQDAATRGDAMRLAWETWLAAEGAARPVVIVLDDLHWGDLPTVRFVDAALRLARAPICVLAFARPEVADSFPDIWRGRELVTIRLGPLPRKACDRLVREVLGADVGDEAAASIAVRADGNAFYLEELIRAFAEGGASALPDTVLGMVEARLDALDDDARRVLRAGSVFGKTFRRGGVLALLGESAIGAVVDSCLDRLVLHETLTRGAHATVPGETELSFRHDLIREAVYATLTEDDRTLGHRLAAAWLERIGAADSNVLAEHFARGDEPARALVHYRRAAELALEGGDLGAALQRARRGVACGAAGEALGALLLVEAEVHRWRGEFSEAEARATEAASALPESSAPWFRAVGEIAVCAGRQAALDRVAGWGLAGANATALPGALSAQVVCLCNAARPLFNAGDISAGDRLADRIEPLAADLSLLDEAARAEVHRLRGGRARHGGDIGTATEHYERALEAFERARDIRNAENGRASLGFSYLCLGEYERAEEALEASRRTAERLGLRPVVARAIQNLALVYLGTGRLDEARAAEYRAVAAGIEQRDGRFESFSRVYLSTICFAQRDLDAALREARAAEAFVGDDFRMIRAGALASMARALVAKESASEALDAAREAAALHAEAGVFEEFDSLIPLALAEALDASGDRPGAIAAITAARDRLLARAERITSAAWRKSFLERVPDHARTLELATAWLAP